MGCRQKSKKSVSLKSVSTYFSSLSRFSRTLEDFLINIIVFLINSAAFVKTTHELEFDLQTASDSDLESTLKFL